MKIDEFKKKLSNYGARNNNTLFKIRKSKRWRR